MMVLGAIAAAVCYIAGRRAGQTSAERSHLSNQKKENEKVDKILRRYAGVGRTELLRRLRGRTPK